MPRLPSPAEVLSTDILSSIVMPRISLKLLLILPFALQICGVVTLVGYLSVRNGRQSVHELAGKVRQQIGHSIENRLEQYLTLPRKVSQTNLQFLQNNLLDFEDNRKVGPFFWHQVKQQQLGYLLYGRTNGELIAAGNNFLNLGITIDEVSPKSHQNKTLYTYAMDERASALRLVQQAPNYSFQKELWYTQTIASGAPGWTKVYQWETAPYPLAIAYGIPVRDRSSKKVIGAIAVEQQLSQLSEFLKTLQTTPGMQTLILERNGQMIATSTDEKLHSLKAQKPQRLSAAQSSNPTTQQISQAIAQQIPHLDQLKQAQNLEVVGPGFADRSYVHVQPWGEQFGLDWLIVIAIPEDDFMGQVNQNTLMTIGLCVAAMLFTILAGLWTARLVSRPLMKLNTTTRAIAQGDFQQQVPHFKIKELETLAQSLNHMAAQLQTSFWDLESMNESLEAHVQDRTATLCATLEQLQAAQAHLVQVEKMSGLGQMVAGIAHEVNNPISFVHGNLKYLTEYIEQLFEMIALYETAYPQPTNDLAQQLDTIDIGFIRQDIPKVLGSMGEGTSRIRDLVLSLRNFARLDESELKNIDLHVSLESALLMVQHRFNSVRSGVRIIKDYQDLPKLECYAGQINQVFLHLLNNAIDALELRYGNFASNTRSQNQLPTITLRTQHEPDRITVSISDNGSGIAQAIQAKIFDPFFTTKPVGQGRGLGLSVCYQAIVDQHLGRLVCESHLGIGTTFSIELPLSMTSVSRDRPIRAKILM